MEFKTKEKFKNRRSSNWSSKPKEATGVQKQNCNNWNLESGVNNRRRRKKKELEFRNRKKAVGTQEFKTEEQEAKTKQQQLESKTEPIWSSKQNLQKQTEAATIGPWCRPSSSSPSSPPNRRRRENNRSNCNEAESITLRCVRFSLCFLLLVELGLGFEDQGLSLKCGRRLLYTLFLLLSFFSLFILFFSFQQTCF